MTVPASRSFDKVCSVMIVCDSLPQFVSSADTTNTFENRLEKLWSIQDMMQHHNSDVMRIVNRSLASLDDTSAL